MDKTMNKIRIVLAEDHEIVREGLRLIIDGQDDMEVVGEAGDGRAAVRVAQELQPDLVVMDVSMPEMNGLSATKKLKQLCPHIGILTLTRHTDDGYLQELLRAGSSGYVLKQSQSSELLQAIRAVVAGGKYLDPAVAGKVIGGFARQQSKSGAASKETPTERELDVLRQIAWGLSNKEIAAKMQISVKTVEAHKANAMRKMNMGSRIDIVRYAILQDWLQGN
jgi:DNA-binding NarL/FixJ family response regulator